MSQPNPGKEEDLEDIEPGRKKPMLTDEERGTFKLLKSMLNYVPKDVMIEILKRVDMCSLLKFCRLSKRIHKLCTDADIHSILKKGGPDELLGKLFRYFLSDRVNNVSLEYTEIMEKDFLNGKMENNSKFVLAASRHEKEMILILYRAPLDALNAIEKKVYDKKSEFYRTMQWMKSHLNERNKAYYSDDYIVTQIMQIDEGIQKLVNLAKDPIAPVIEMRYSSSTDPKMDDPLKAIGWCSTKPLKPWVYLESDEKRKGPIWITSYDIWKDTIEETL